MTAKQRIKEGERVRIRERKTKVTLHRKDQSNVQKICHQLISVESRFKSLGYMLVRDETLINICC
jgi:hypothetical protein